MPDEPKIGRPSTAESSAGPKADERARRAVEHFDDGLVELEELRHELSQVEVRRLVSKLRSDQFELRSLNERLRETQIELERARDAYFDLYENAPAGYATVDRDGVITRANLTSSAIIGIPWSQIRGHHLSEFVHPADSEACRLKIQEAFETGLRQQFDSRLGAASGAWFPVRMELLPSRRPDSESVCASCRVMFVDISDKKQAENTIRMTQEVLEEKAVDPAKELAEIRRRLESALEGANMGMWEVNLRSDKIFYDKGFLRLVGYSEDELDDAPAVWGKLVHPEDLERFSQKYGLHVSGESPQFDSEQRFKTGTGEWRWFLVKGKIVERDASDRPVRMSGTLLDVTNRNETERRLRESEERFRRVFESVPDMILLKDVERRLTHVNPAVENLLEKSASELVGLRAEDLFPAPYCDQIAEFDRRCLAGEPIEVEHTRPYDGVYMSFLDLRTPLRNESGAVIGICIVSRDITGRRSSRSGKTQVEEYQAPVMRETIEIARQCAQSDAFVLLQGESGTGKDYLAKWIHNHSPRSGGSFFSINCAALPDQMLESELFGHEKGAFTGAVSRKKGLVELAEGGTLLLNEIGELPLSLQAKLLTFLDTKRFQRVGGEKNITVNARLMAASHRDLKKEVKAGRFMEPLYYRVNVLNISIPPLRDRVEDIPIIVQQLMSDITKELPSPKTPRLTAASFKRLANYHWPGNIRELRNVVERALILAKGPEVDIKLPQDAISQPLPTSEEEGPSLNIGPDETIAQAKSELIRTMCRYALKRYGGNKSAAAMALGVSRDALYRYLRELDV